MKHQAVRSNRGCHWSYPTSAGSPSPRDTGRVRPVAPGSRWSSPRSLKYSDDFILLEVAFISGRPKETRLALLKELNARIVAGAEISPDDLMIQLSEFPGENFSFGQGLAQRAFVSQGTREA